MSTSSDSGWSVVHTPTSERSVQLEGDQDSVQSSDSQCASQSQQQASRDDAGLSGRGKSDEWFRVVQQALTSIEQQRFGGSQKVQTAAQTVEKAAGMLRKKIMDVQHWDHDLRDFSKTLQQRCAELHVRESNVKAREAALDQESTEDGHSDGTSNSARAQLKLRFARLCSELATSSKAECREGVRKFHEMKKGQSAGSANQDHNLNTTVNNNREQLGAHTLMIARLEAELAASRAESARVMATYDTKLDAVMQMVKNQESSFAVQQGRGDSHDDALRLKIEVLEKRVNELPSLADGEADATAALNGDSTVTTL